MMGSMGGIAAETNVEAGCSRSLHSVLTYKNITKQIRFSFPPVSCNMFGTELVLETIHAKVPFANTFKNIDVDKNPNSKFAFFKF